MGTGAVNTSIIPLCSYCNGYHTGSCPRIEEIEYHSNGSIKRVRLRPLVSFSYCTCSVHAPTFCPRCGGRIATNTITVSTDELQEQQT